jgi:hypothetical protein
VFVFGFVFGVPRGGGGGGLDGCCGTFGPRYGGGDGAGWTSRCGPVTFGFGMYVGGAGAGPGPVGGRGGG